VSAYLVEQDGEVSIEPSEGASGAGEIQLNGQQLTGKRLLTSGDLLGCQQSCAVYYRRPKSSYRGRVMSRAELTERLRQETQRALRYQRSLAVLLLDGTPRPDQRELFLQRVLESVRYTDLVGFDGVSELMCVLPETDTTADVPARRLLSAVEPLLEGARIGIARCPRDGTDAESLLSGAREAALSAASGKIQTVSSAAHEILVGEQRLVAADPKTRRLFALLRDLAPSDLPVLICGETGVGKELVAQALHHFSARSQGPLVSLNCAAVTESLLESELFGYEKGAFSGADRSKPGLLESAAGGTVFLDEISESSPKSQAELLRVLETHKLRRVGSLTERSVDVRFIAATNRDIREEVEAGRFRRDLFYRLNAALVEVPPLRERPLDIAPLAHSFLQSACERLGRTPPELSTLFLQRLQLHPFAGNVRELRNLMELLAATRKASCLDADDLPAHVAGDVAPWLARPASTGPEHPAVGDRTRDEAQARDQKAAFRPLADEVRELEARRMREALEISGGVRIRAAELIGMPLRTFVTKLKRYGLGHVGRG
jgi:two-component system response regulator AtoC